MGSGPSKQKTQEKGPPPRSDNVSKSARRLNIENNEKKQQTVAEKERVTNHNETNKVKTGMVTTKDNNIKKGNGKVNNNENRKKLGNFESDSESEGEDINAVLEATRNEYNSRLKSQNQQNAIDTDTSYPETYAQRLQREQYRNPPQGILRQKTIYRNPDEWDVDEIETENFNVSKFKEANLQSLTAKDENSMLNRDIFTPNNPEMETNQRMKAPDPENYFFQPNEKKKSLPHYDTSEEALLAEIEKEFDL